MLIRVFFLFLLLWTWVTATVLSADEGVVVTTKLGEIWGFKEKSTRGNEFYSFHSIPYAKPPVGELRLKDPVSSEGWIGIRNGSVVPPLCPQIPFIAATKRSPAFDGDEDCLYLSVFTSKPSRREAELPVMVFIHGGAFFAGGLSKYTPYVLLNEDIVLVIIQYRLGILGFLSTEDDVIPGNFGLKDQVLALQLVQKEIHNFGGDKNRVTIFGESAGGASVHFHVLSPYSKGLFSRGILQSGTLFSPWAMGGAFREVAKYTGDLFDCPAWASGSQEQSSISLLKCLQEVNVVNLTLSHINHIHWNFNPVLLGPRVDGDYIPEAPELLMKEGRHQKVNLISGVNSHEGGLFVFPLYSNEAFKEDLLNNFSEMGPASLDITFGDTSPAELAAKIFEYYVGGVKVNPEDADNLCRMYGDWQFVLGHDLVAKLFARSAPDNQIFLYELNHRGQRSFGNLYDTDIGKTWVDHVDDLFYLFTGGNTLWQPLERDEDLRLRNIMTKLWYNFAATGNPTPDNSLGFKWEAVSEHDLDHLSLMPLPSMENDQRQEVRKFLTSLPTKQNYLLHPEHVSVQQLKPVEDAEEEPKITTPRKYGVRDEL